MDWISREGRGTRA